MTQSPRPKIAVAPDTRPTMHRKLCAAVEAGGGQVSPLEEATGLVWADPARPDLFPEMATRAPHLEWIQLPYAGIEPFAQHLDPQWTWTCGKGVYSNEVAETALAMSLAGFKNLHDYARQQSWSGPVGRVLSGSNLTILGGGGITRSLLPLLAPFNCDISVVRRSGEPMEGANRTLTSARLMEVLPRTDLLILALSLTAETRGIIGAAELAALPEHTWIVNVARGGHIDTEALVQALKTNSIGGAALDVTDPEPLPDQHPLWSLPNCLITPHIGNTPDMGLEVLVPFIEENVRRFSQGQELLAPVDVSLGY